MWINTWNSGVFKYNPTTNIYKRYTPIEGDATSLAGYSGRIFYIDSNNTLWISTRQGLSKYNYSTDSFTNYYHDPDDPTTISDNTVFVVLNDPVIYPSIIIKFWYDKFG